MAAVRTLLLTSIMAPHREALFRELSRDDELDLHVVYLARSDPTRLWDLRSDPSGYQASVLNERARWPRSEAYVHLSTGLTKLLRRKRPEVLIIGGWDQPAFLAAALEARASGARVLWWVESTLRDERSESSWALRTKRRLLRRSAGAVVPGSASRDYVRSLGLADDRIWVAPNAVDNSSFALARSRPVAAQPASFLFAGRLEPSKGLATLLDGWGLVRADASLVIAGAGSMSEAVAARVGSASSRIRMTGYLQQDELARTYASSSALVLTSVSEPWGLVINEAMAAGLPVISTEAPGAVADLVADGVNGRVIPAR